jgi:hypothetical protein
MPELGEETKTTIRLSPEDRKNVLRIIASGAASNTAESIRVALAIVPTFLKTPAQLARVARQVAGPSVVNITPTSPSATARKRGPIVARMWHFNVEKAAVEVSERVGFHSVELKVFDFSNDDWDPEEGPPTITVYFSSADWLTFVDVVAGEVQVKEPRGPLA